MQTIGCRKHYEWVRECADKAITLVKDTHNNLPMSPLKTRRILLEVLHSSGSLLPLNKRKYPEAIYAIMSADKIGGRKPNHGRIDPVGKDVFILAWEMS